MTCIWYPMKLKKATAWSPFQYNNAYKVESEGSNPRPNKQSNCFLHAQFSLIFHRVAGRKPPTTRLASLEFKTAPKLFGFYVDFYGASNRDAVNKGFPETSRLPTWWELGQYPTIIQIRQQERSYSRHLKMVKQIFTSISFLARHAYNSIRLAVKTSRPQ